MGKTKDADRTYVSIDSIIPNTWNYNRQSPDRYRLQIDSIKKHGLITDIQVYENPDKKGQYIIINGEHRWKAAKELGYEDMPVTIVPNITEIDAMRICIKLNEMEGDDKDAIQLGTILKMINDSREVSYDQLLEEMPYTKSELDNLLSLDSFDINDFMNPEDELGEGIDSEEVLDKLNQSNVNLKIVLSPEEFNLYHNIKKSLQLLSDNEVVVEMCRITNGYLTNKNSKRKRTPAKFSRRDD